MRFLLSCGTLVCGLGLLTNCGVSADGDGSHSGGASSGGSSTGGANAGSAATGGTATGGTANAGGAGSGGTSPDAGGTAGAGGSTSCPPVSVTRLFPIVGPFFMGPDPGPCSQTEGQITSTFIYEGELVSSSTIGGGETYERDGMGRMVRYITPTITYEQTYAPGFLYDSTEDYVVTYALNADGYPTEGVQDIDKDGEPDNVWTYVYEDCRLTQRLAPEGYPARTYEYDDVGHVIATREPERVITFDYSCWADP